MKRSRIYSKYKQERKNARLLKITKQELTSKAPEPTLKKNLEVQQRLGVSLPIKHFINVQNKRYHSVLIKDRNDEAELKVPKLVIKMNTSTDSKHITQKLRQIRRNVSNSEQNKNTDESNSTVSKKEILRELSVVLSTELNDISQNRKSSLERGTNKSVDQTTQCSESTVCTQRKVIPVKSPKGIESYRTCHTIAETLSNTESSKDTLREPMYLLTRVEFERYDKLLQNSILQESGELGEQNLEHCKRIKQVLPAEIEIIDLDSDNETDKLNQEIFDIALSHSETNKNIIRALRNQMTNSTIEENVEVSHPTRGDRPFPFVNPNLANTPARVDTPANDVVSTSNALPAYTRSSAATTLSNSQSMTLSPKSLVHNNAPAKDTTISPLYSTEFKKIGQGNDQSGEVNLNTLAETANSLNKLTHMEPLVTALRKYYQLRLNQLAQKQHEKTLELKSHKHMMHPSQMLPPKLQPPQTLPAQLQPPKSQPPQAKPHLSQQPQLLQMLLQQPQPQQVQPHYSQSTQLQLSMSQLSPLHQLQTLQQQPTQQQLQQLPPHYLQPTQLQLSIKSQPTQLNLPQTQPPLQQPPPLLPPQPQPSQMQFLHQPSYPQPTQMPRSQSPSFYRAQQRQQNVYYSRQQQNTQQNGQYVQRQDNYPNVYGIQNHRTNTGIPRPHLDYRGGDYLHPGGQRKPPRSWSTVAARSSCSRMMPYNDNNQQAQNAPYPNYFPQKMHWNNPNHYW